jgi:NAD-dependent SIR2 family protein deacetylase
MKEEEEEVRYRAHEILAYIKKDIFPSRLTVKGLRYLADEIITKNIDELERRFGVDIDEMEKLKLARTKPIN